MNNSFQQRFGRALETASTELLAARNAQGFWEGELSSSALSTATAVTALAIALKHGSSFQSAIRNPQSAIDSGLQWLAAHTNADGGWGDTTKSLSNISTTTLCWAAFGAAGADEKFAETIRNARRWLVHHSVPPASRRAGPDDKSSATHCDSAEPGGTPGARFADQLARAIIARYGKDRTFSVPILTMCALAGRLGEGREAWKHVIPLPFELAACPHQLFAALRLPVVSYALPALIAIGQARHVHAPSRNPFARIIRKLTRQKTLRVLTEIQPSNGGFLEAIPLTSFVTLSLAASGQQNHIVTQRGLEFLLKSQRPDGSWPIDTNLATWCTTLAIDALPQSAILNPQSSIAWLLQQQYTTEHPYTHAAPGGWAWTDLPGGVPDADDTAGALLALHKLFTGSSRGDETLEKAESGKRKAGTDKSLVTSTATWSEEVLRAAESGIRWLLDLQNRDGGIPTFCRGWGTLPFDRSSPDITAHAIRAWVVWQKDVSAELREKIHSGLHRSIHFLARTQAQDGSWSPLWFGNQFSATEENLTYGTARVVRALADVRQALRFYPRIGPPKPFPSGGPAIVRGLEWLVRAQKTNGSWGGSKDGPSSSEETALATEALAAVLMATTVPGTSKLTAQAALQGATWLCDRIEDGTWLEPSPIGFYFAKLWYFERLYPMIFTIGALRATAELFEEK